MGPDRLSVTRITAYLACPRRYRFRYIDHLPPEGRAADLVLGSAVHSSIAAWFEARLEGTPLGPEAARRTFRADWTAESIGHEVDYGGADRARLVQLGQDLVGLFVHRFENEPVTGAEVPFEIPLGRLDVPLVGYIDFLADGLIGEIKTVSRRTSPSHWDLQLAAYTIAYSASWGSRPTTRLVQLIKGTEPQVHVMDLSLTAREERWFVEVATEVHGAISRGAFHPAPSWACSRCEYRRACRR